MEADDRAQNKILSKITKNNRHRNSVYFMSWLVIYLLLLTEKDICDWHYVETSKICWHIYYARSQRSEYQNMIREDQHHEYEVSSKQKHFVYKNALVFF